MMAPHFSSLSEFLAMGGHAAYVWSSWGISVLVLLGMIGWSYHQRQQTIRALHAQQLRQRRQATSTPPNTPLPPQSS